MSTRERRRLVVLARVRDQGMSLKTAAEAMGLSYRQTRRIWARYRAEGDKGLVHRSRGRPSNHQLDVAFKEAVIRRYQERYEGFGPTLAAEKLSGDGYALNHETLRRWLLAAGIIKKRRKRAKHRSARQRRAHFGELVQLDGSFHSWFEDRGPVACLMEMIDDATGIRLAVMSEQETTADAMVILAAWTERYGVPEALYTDRKTVYVTDREPTIAEQLAGVESLTAFGEACANLGIRIIAARSPEAKGRVERAHAVLQDRFVKELRLEGASTIDEANTLLAGGFTHGLNTKFAVPAARDADRHRPLAKSEDLTAIMSVRQTRTVASDFTICHDRRVLQITKQQGLPKPKDKVIVARYLDGSLHLFHRKRDLNFADITATHRQATPELRQEAAKQQRYAKPKADHPWRKSTDRRLALKAAIAAKARY